MTLTEEEAKTKWCPFTRIVMKGYRDSDALLATANRDSIDAGSGLGPTCNCIASDCMAWRPLMEAPEDKIHAIKRRREEAGTGLIESKQYVEAHPEYTQSVPSGRGFCGLAGRPA